MGTVLLIVLGFTSPFIFAGGVNVKTFIAYIILVGSIIIMQYSIKRVGNTLIDLLLTIILGVLSGILVSIYFGFFSFGFSLSEISEHAIHNPHEASAFARRSKLIISLVSVLFIFSSYCLALYDFFM